MSDFDVRLETEEHIPDFAQIVLLLPDPAVRKGRDGGNASVDRLPDFAAGFDHAPVALLFPPIDVPQRQFILIEQFRNLGCRREGLLLGTSVLHGLRPQGLDASLELIRIHEEPSAEAARGQNIPSWKSPSSTRTSMAGRRLLRQPGSGLEDERR